MLRTILSSISVFSLCLSTGCSDPAQPDTRSTKIPPAAPALTNVASNSITVPDLSELPAPYNLANYTKGKKVYAMCSSCHSLSDGPHRTGPNLNNIFGKKAGSFKNYSYSDALQSSEIIWTPETMDQWITKPTDLIAKSKMNFAGLRRENQRQDLIAFMLIETGFEKIE